MPSPVDRRAVDLSSFPDLVVIYLGMRVRTLAGIKTLLGLGPQIDRAGAGRPEGLLHFENKIIFTLFPLHLGMRWYWKDFESMERWARSEPHRIWWQNFLRSSGGTGASAASQAARWTFVFSAAQSRKESSKFRRRDASAFRSASFRQDGRQCR